MALLPQALLRTTATVLFLVPLLCYGTGLTGCSSKAHTPCDVCSNSSVGMLRGRRHVSSFKGFISFVFCHVKLEQ